MLGTDGGYELNQAINKYVENSWIFGNLRERKKQTLSFYEVHDRQNGRNGVCILQYFPSSL